MFGEHYQYTEGGERLFTVDPRPIKVGPGAVQELGSDARALGIRRPAVFTDSAVMRLEPEAQALDPLKKAGIGLDRKILADIAYNDAAAFAKLVKQAGLS